MTVTALRQHRPEVLAELLERYGREIQGLAYLILRNRSAAEDVVVDTLLTALDRADTLRNDDALRPWLLRVATNRALAVRRSEARVVTLTVVPDQAAPSLDEDQRLTLLAAVGRLAPRTRAAVVLRYYADLPVRDVAEALGTSENTVKTQLREALGQLRRSLEVDQAIGVEAREVLHG
jgi:RNA polymerase sigma factor (sigma-70 family)